MFGVKFIQASNSLICGGCKFEVLPEGAMPHVTYAVMFGPDGITLAEIDERGQQINVRRRVEREDVIALLPKTTGWSWQTFLFALTAWGEGHEAGRNYRHSPRMMREATEQKQEATA